MNIWLFSSALVCLVLVTRTDSCNVEIISSRTPSNVTSPGYPFTAYQSNLYCWWRIDASNQDNGVIVRVLDSYIELSRNCVFDSLSFYDGPDTTGPSLGRLCGQNRTSVISSGRSIYIVFKTDSSNQYKGFLLEFYETTRCGGALTATPDETTFVSPGFPYQYLNNMNCVWFITAENENDTIVVEFDQMQVEEVLGDCTNDHVTVYNDHQTDREQLLGQFCGSSKPILQSSRNEMRISFKTDLSGVGKGFSLNFKTVKAGECNLTMPADSTPIYFVSPGYPLAYDNDLECVWEIVATSQQYIQIDVIGSHIEGNYPLCSNDSVTVYEGRDINAPELGRFCGNFRPSFSSNASAMTVAFTTDGEDVDKGFRIRYRSHDAPPVTTVSPSPARQCGSTILSAVRQGQYLESPGYPSGYGNNEQCIWTITAASLNNYVKIDVIDSILEDGDECQYDFVEAFDGSNIGAPLIKKWCSTMQPTLQSSGQAMTLMFKSDSSNTFRGFRLQYTETNLFPTSSPQCGAEYFSAIYVNQYLQSPGYPAAYQNNQQCIWTIESDLNNIVQIIVEDSHLEGGTGCPDDYVKVFDGDSIHSQMLQVWCDLETPTVQSSGQYMTLLFKTDASVTYKGFRLRYFQTSVTPSPTPPQCSNSAVTALTSDQYLQSPGYPNDYPNNDECVWTITAATSSYTVKIVVLDSILEGGSNCPYDFVKVYDGSSTSSRMIQVWCDRMTPTVQSSGRYMTLMFKSDDSNTYKGFRLKYYETAAVPQCGTSDLTAQTSYQYLQSPGYPNDYPNNDRCMWTITAAASSKVVKIEVLDSVLEGGSNCPYDFVKVYDGPGTSSRMIRVWCDRMEPTVQSSGPHMALVFKSDNSNTFKGFRLKYYETDGSCGGQLNALSYDQYMTSPGYPQNYQINMDCTWTITTEMSDIKINVLDSDIESSSSCSFDYVEVYDGSSTSSDVVGKFCGTQMPTYVSSGTSITIKFHSDSSNTQRGFRLSYTGGSFPACSDQDITAYTYTSDLTSPNYPYNYPNNADCSWTISTDLIDYVINADVISSDLEYSSGCSYDYYEFFDGSDDTFTSLGKYCGSSLPTRHSSGQYMYIKFHSDNSNTGTGFKLTYQAQSSDNFSDLDPPNIVAIVGGSIGGFVLIIVICSLIAVASKKKSRPVVNQRRNDGIYNVSQGPYETTITPANFQPPPPYSQVVGPPPYPQPVATSDTAPIVTQVPETPNQ